MMQAIKEILKVINLFTVMSREFPPCPYHCRPHLRLQSLADLIRWLMLLRHTERATKDKQYPLPIIYFLFCFMNFIMVSHSSQEPTYKRRQIQHGFEVVQRAEVLASKLNGKCLFHHFKYETIKKQHHLTF